MDSNTGRASIDLSRRKTDELLFTHVKYLYEDIFQVIL